MFQWKAKQDKRCILEQFQTKNKSAKNSNQKPITQIQFGWQTKANNKHCFDTWMNEQSFLFCGNEKKSWEKRQKNQRGSKQKWKDCSFTGIVVKDHAFSFAYQSWTSSSWNWSFVLRESRGKMLVMCDNSRKLTTILTVTISDIKRAQSEPGENVRNTNSCLEVNNENIFCSFSAKSS